MTTATGRAPSPLLVGAVVWITSELLFFGTLFGAWFSLRGSNAGHWPPAGIEVGRVLPALGTVVLVTSSVTMQLAARRAGDGRTGAVRRWLGITLALGAFFLVLLAREWSSLEFSIDDHAYATA